MFHKHARQWGATAGCVVLAAGVLAGHATSAASAHSAQARHSLPAVLVCHAASLHPQGVAWDPSRRAFLVSSIRHGTVSVVAADGTVRTLISHPRMVSTTGVHVDRLRGRVLVGYADVGLGVRTSPETVLRLSGVGIFDLATGRPLHIVDLDQVPGRHVITDLAVDEHGNAYATDSASDAIYQIDPQGRPSVLVRDPRFAAPVVGIAGIVWHPDGYLLVVNSGDGTLFRVSPRGSRSVDVVTLDQPLVGGDGMALRRDGALVVVINSLTGSGANAISVLRGTRGWSAARTVSQQPWPDPDPTTVAITPSGGYVVSGHLRELATGNPTDTFTLRRVQPQD